MSYRKLEEIFYIVVHDYETTDDIGAEEIRLDHMQRGYMDIGYHYVIKRDGTVEIGRPITRPGTHCRGYNHNSIGICLVGKLSTSPQLDALHDLALGLENDNCMAVTLGHGDMPKVNKICPSFNVGEFMRTRRGT